MIAMQHPASPAKDAGSFNYDESRNPRRRLADGATPSFWQKPESTSLPGVSRPASCHRHRHHSRLSSESPNPYRLPDGPTPSFRQKPEPTSPPGVSRPASCHRHRHSPPVFPAKAGTHVPSPAPICPRVATNAATATRLSGESRNPRPFPDGRIPTSSHRRRLALPWMAD